MPCPPLLLVLPACMQELVCTDDAPNCPLVYSQPPEGQRYYIADIERFTLLIDHGVLAAKQGLAGEGRCDEHSQPGNQPGGGGEARLQFLLGDRSG